MLSARSRRWAAPVAVAVAIGAGVGIGGALSAGASPPLPHKSAAQLLTDVHNAHVAGMSGTIVQNADLGLPALPTRNGGQGSSNLSSLITGSHTLRVWYAGPDKMRLALLGTLGESDVIRSGRDLWVWSSTTNSATHMTVPAGGAAHHRESLPDQQGALTPQQAANKALAAISPSTKVSTAGTATVAGRPSYEITLAPRDSRSLIGSVRIAIDSATHVPLRVQIYSSGSSAKPALEVGFTHVSFATPDASQFTFAPPKGATVHQARPGGLGMGAMGPRVGAHRMAPGGKGPVMKHPLGASAHGKPTVVGKGWTQVAVIPGVSMPAGRGNGELAAVMGSLPKVSGSWGSGTLLKSSLFSALFTNDGRMIIGAVPPDQLYAAAAHR